MGNAFGGSSIPLPDPKAIEEYMQKQKTYNDTDGYYDQNNVAFLQDGINSNTPRKTDRPDSQYFAKTSYTSTGVPDKTIKRGYDTYKNPNFSGSIIGEKVGGGASHGADCGHQTRNTNDIYLTDGVQRNGQDREMWCRDYFGAADCGDCDFWPQAQGGNEAKAKRGSIVSARVPVGSKLYATSGTAGTNANESSVTCDGGSNFVNNIGWNFGDYQYSTKMPEKLPDEVATGCAGGANLGRDSYVKTLNGFQINNTNDNNSSDICYVGANMKQPNKITCLNSSVDWPTFCQMGDYISSVPKCTQNCYSVPYDDNAIPDNSLKYCQFARERYCSKLTGDPIKRDDDTLQVINSTNDKIAEDPFCVSHCQPAESSICQNAKKNVCTRDPAFWTSKDWMPNFCKSFWSKNPDRTSMTKVCKKDLEDSTSSQNVFSGKGCGMLCLGSNGGDIDKSWCDDRRQAYCTSSDKNMLTDKCYDFCSQNPDRCQQYLQGSSGLCTRQGIATQEDMDINIPETRRNYGDFCGCMMNTDFYQKYINDITKQYNEAGYDIKTQIDLTPECMYPSCKTGIKTQTQKENIKNCKQCVQLVFQNFVGSTILDSNIANNQASTCGNVVTALPLKPGLYKITGQEKYYKIFDNGQYCRYDTKAEFDKDANGQAPKEIPKMSDLNAPVKAVYCSNLPPGNYTVTGNDRYTISDKGYCSYSSMQDYIDMNGADKTPPEQIEKAYLYSIPNLGICATTTQKAFVTLYTNIYGQDALANLTPEKIQNYTNIFITIIIILGVILLLIIILIIWLAVRGKSK